MPRAGVQELVYVMLAMHPTYVEPAEVEVHGTRSEAEKAAEALLRAEGYSTKDSRFSGTGELIAVHHGRAVGTKIFVLPRQIIRKSRVLREKTMDEKWVGWKNGKRVKTYARRGLAEIALQNRLVDSISPEYKKDNDDAQA